MPLIKDFRFYAFYLKEYLTGRKILKNISEIENHFISGNKNSQLNILLKHSIDTVKYYSSISEIKLDNFPVVNKSIIKSDQNLFISEKYSIEKLLKVTTSGSTGTPFITYQDISKKRRNYADTLYFARLAGFDLGMCLIYLKIWVREKMASKFHYKIQNIIPVDVIKFEDKQIEQLIKELENKNNTTFAALGYVSALEQIIRYLDKKSKSFIDAKFSSVITMSESLSFESKNKLESIFRCPVVSRYSNLENGIIAQQETNGKNRFLINTASYFIEILEFDKDERVADGETGRIVVTDLYNFAMPLLRYDTGDVGAIERDPDEPNKVFLSKVEGRRLDLLFDTNGQIVSSYIVYKNMWQYPEIQQYQLVQTHINKYKLIVNIDAEFKHESKLIDEFKEYLGKDAIIVVEYVSEIPLLASGKRRKIVNLYKNTI